MKRSIVDVLLNIEGLLGMWAGVVISAWVFSVQPELIPVFGGSTVVSLLAAVIVAFAPLLAQSVIVSVMLSKEAEANDRT